MDRKAVVIYAPTASGKSEFSLCLALRTGGEVISCDSMSVYKYMNIGTAKPLEFLDIVKHHLIDILEPGGYYDAKLFSQQAEEIIKSLKSEGKLPIVVGGTYLYLQALLYGLAHTPEPNWKLRKRLYEIAERKGSAFLYRKLEAVDRAYAKKIHPNDLRRVVRALEVFLESFKPFSSFHSWDKPRIPYVGFYLKRSKESLMERIERRVLEMFKRGLVEEVKSLLEMGFKDFLTSSQAIGYKEVVPYIEGRISLQEAMEKVIRNTKNYAKRQIRWAKGKGFIEIDLDRLSISEGVELVISYLSSHEIL